MKEAKSASSTTKTETEMTKTTVPTKKTSPKKLQQQCQNFSDWLTRLTKLKLKNNKLPADDTSQIQWMIDEITNALAQIDVSKKIKPKTKESEDPKESQQKIKDALQFVLNALNNNVKPECLFSSSEKPQYIHYGMMDDTAAEKSICPYSWGVYLIAPIVQAINNINKSTKKMFDDALTACGDNAAKKQNVVSLFNEAKINGNPATDGASEPIKLSVVTSLQTIQQNVNNIIAELRQGILTFEDMENRIKTIFNPFTNAIEWNKNVILSTNHALTTELSITVPNTAANEIQTLANEMETLLKKHETDEKYILTGDEEKSPEDKTEDEEKEKDTDDDIDKDDKTIAARMRKKLRTANMLQLSDQMTLDTIADFSQTTPNIPPQVPPNTPTDINTLIAKITALESKIVDTKQKIDNLQQNSLLSPTQIDEIKNSISDVTSKTENNKQQLTDINTKVDTLVQDVQSSKDEIYNIVQKLDNIPSGDGGGQQHSTGNMFETLLGDNEKDDKKQDNGNDMMQMMMPMMMMMMNNGNKNIQSMMPMLMLTMMNGQSKGS